MICNVIFEMKSTVTGDGDELTGRGRVDWKGQVDWEGTS